MQNLSLEPPSKNTQNTAIPCVTEYPGLGIFPDSEVFLAFYKSARIQTNTWYNLMKVSAF